MKKKHYKFISKYSSILGASLTFISLLLASWTKNSYYIEGLLGTGLLLLGLGFVIFFLSLFNEDDNIINY